MAQLIWTEPALLDLDEIAEYIALDYLSAAQGLVDNVFGRAELLALFQNPADGPLNWSTPHIVKLLLGHVGFSIG